MRLAVIIPVYNEERLLAAAVERLRATPAPIAHGSAMERVIVLVDDGSDDGTRGVVEWLAREPDVIVDFHPRNLGKGAAVRTGLRAALRANADVVLIHDGDLEYDPGDHAGVVAPIVRGETDAVIGSRFAGLTRDGMYSLHRAGNAIVTAVSNEFTGLALTDMECCLKAFRREVASRLRIEENRFGVEPELVAKLARMPGVRVREVPVTYRGRSFAEGKKISWRDGFSALRCVVAYSLRS